MVWQRYWIFAYKMQFLPAKTNLVTRNYLEKLSWSCQACVSQKSRKLLGSEVNRKATETIFSCFWKCRKFWDPYIFRNFRKDFLFLFLVRENGLPRPFFLRKSEVLHEEKNLETHPWSAVYRTVSFMSVGPRQTGLLLLEQCERVKLFLLIMHRSKIDEALSNRVHLRPVQCQHHRNLASDIKIDH